MSITTVNTCNTTITTDLSAIERLMDHGKWEVLWVGREWEDGEREVVRERTKRVHGKKIKGWKDNKRVGRDQERVWGENEMVKRLKEGGKRMKGWGEKRGW